MSLSNHRPVTRETKGSPDQVWYNEIMPLDTIIVLRSRQGSRAGKPQSQHNRAALFRWIVQYKRRHDGNSPAMREIARACRISSVSVVNYHLKALEREGRIRLECGTGRSRNIVVVGGKWTYKKPGRPRETSIRDNSH